MLDSDGYLVVREPGHLPRQSQKTSLAKRIKILSLGDPGVGKSCIIKRFCEGRFVPDYISTIGIDYGVKSSQINNVDIKVNFWDVAGDPIYYDVRTEFYKDTMAALLVYDVNSQKSFDALDRWGEEMKKMSGNDVLICLIGNKVDKPNRVVATELGEKYAQRKGYLFFETSAESGSNVKEMFDLVFLKVLEKIPNI